MKVKDVLEPVITLNFVPGVGIFQCVSTGMTITGKRLVCVCVCVGGDCPLVSRLPDVITEYWLFIMWVLGSEVTVDLGLVLTELRLKGIRLSRGGKVRESLGRGSQLSSVSDV